MNNEYIYILILLVLTSLLAFFKRNVDDYLTDLKKDEKPPLYTFLLKWYVPKISEDRIQLETAVLGYGGIAISLLVGLLVFLGF